MTNRLNLKDYFGSDEPRPEPTMISILSGKGGVGKSVIAMNLADRIAADNRRVLLVDADFSTGNLHVLANVASNHGMRRFARNEQPLNRLVRPLTESVDLLTASAGTPLEEFEDVKFVGGFARRLREQAREYDAVVIDHASGVSKAATILASVCDINLVVLVPELTSISDAYGLCKYLFTTYEAIDCRLLVNRIQSEEELTYVRTKFEAVTQRFLGRSPEFAGWLPEDRAVRTAVARQQPIAQAVPESVIGQSLNKIIRVLIPESMGQMQQVQIAPSEWINSKPAPADIRE